MATKKAAKKSSKSKTSTTGRSTHKKTYPTKSGKRSTTPPSNRWSGNVTSDSTHPGEGLFTKGASTIAKSLASKEVSPEGPGQGMRMLSFYINRAGKNLSAERRETLNRAKEILRGIEEEQKSETKKSGSNKTKKAAKKSSK